MAARRAHRRTLLLAALLAFALPAPVRCEPEQELLLFLSGGPTYHDVTPDDGREDYDWFLDADILYTLVNGRFRLIGEYIASTHETELERLQLGWQGEGQNIGWLGRFHSPGRYWNVAYHHGQYLQTSISRPLIEQFEDEGGVLPTHVTGVLLQTEQGLSGPAVFRGAASFGAAPVIDRNQLRPFDLLDPDSDNNATADLRLSFVPDPLGENQAGLLLGASRLQVDGSSAAERQGVRRVEQLVAAPYLDWRWQDVRVISSLALVSNRLEGPDRGSNDTFLSGYVQGEYSPRDDWTVFGRVEDTSDTRDSDYLQLFPHAVTARRMLGLRFDFARNQALTVEISRAETRYDEFGQALLQWSAVLP